MKEYYNKNYLITGGASGIGMSVASRLTEEGARVILVSSNKKKLESSIWKLEGSNNLYYQYDLSDTKNIEHIFSFLHLNNIVLDGMIHCAGISPLCLIADNSPELMEKVFNINVLSFFELVKYFQREENSKQGSKIVAVSSITARGAGYRQTLYGASKAALSSAIKLMAKELLNRDIHINAVSPGVCDTDMLYELKQKSDNLNEKVKQSQPLGIIPPKEVSDVILFLLSEAGNYITGTDMVYDGGALLK